MSKARRGSDYGELHCHSNFSFLDGASHPEDLVAQAAKLGLAGLGLVDHNGFYGVVRFARAAKQRGVPTVFGAELSLVAPTARNKSPDPPAQHLVVLARNAQGYARLSQTIATAQLKGGKKGHPIYCLEELAAQSRGDWAVLTGCRKGAVPAAVLAQNSREATEQLQLLRAMFGSDNVFVELWDHGEPLDTQRNDLLAELAKKQQVATVATNNVHYATASDYDLFTALAAVRARQTLDQINGRLPVSGAAHLRSGWEQWQRLGSYPGAMQTAGQLIDDCAFDLQLVAPQLPDFPLALGRSESDFLRQLTEQGAQQRYGSRDDPQWAHAWKQLERELEIIERLEFPGYFLVVWDIVRFCRDNNILCQGRGSAANSAVCYAIGITNVDPVRYELLFERFLSPDRHGPPDIDVDIESGRREEVIQYVYNRYGRDRSAQVANVITYRNRSAVRDMAKALGHSIGQQDAWSKQLERRDGLVASEHEIPDAVVGLATRVANFPRHLGIHSGGMVICDRPIAQVCPVEWATKEGRTVLQWDKDDCAEVGLVKFDLLGLGMLSAIHRALDLVRMHHDQDVDLAHLPHDDDVYEMLGRADSIGVFQVESRAQIATLPRLRPKCFYDLAIEVALIRPGPIQGNAVHPFIRRHNGEEEITYLHPLLEPALRRTKGVPLFQEQLMHMAIDAAGFSPAEADSLRQAISSKRSEQRMQEMQVRLFSGMKANGIPDDVAVKIYESMKGFANFGFAESHSISFALLVYASAYLKLHWPAAFLTALLNSQPMGFWSPQSLIADARRHGVVVHGPDVNSSGADCDLERDHSVRLGLGMVRLIDCSAAARIQAAQPFSDAQDVVRRADVSAQQLESLASAGALDSFGQHRRQALWEAGIVAQYRSDRLPHIGQVAKAPSLEPMSSIEVVAADLWTTGVSVDRSPMEFVRTQLESEGVLTASQLPGARNGGAVKVAGVVTHRQRPETASGITFINLEDESGHINVVCSMGVWKRYRRACGCPILMVRGRLEKANGVVNVVATKIEALEMSTKMNTQSRSWC